MRLKHVTATAGPPSETIWEATSLMIPCLGEPNLALHPCPSQTLSCKTRPRLRSPGHQADAGKAREASSQIAQHSAPHEMHEMAAAPAALHGHLEGKRTMQGQPASSWPGAQQLPLQRSAFFGMRRKRKACPAGAAAPGPPFSHNPLPPSVRQALGYSSVHGLTRHLPSSALITAHSSSSCPVTA